MRENYFIKISDVVLTLVVGFCEHGTIDTVQRCKATRDANKADWQRWYDSHSYLMTPF
jgi:hypothetical protein